MNHEQAVQQSATERYLMDELSPELRDEFEEHFFGCSECAVDVRSASLFIEQSKRILGEKAELPAVPAAMGKPVRPVWFGWLRPALAVPVLAILVAVIAYQNLITYPQLKASLEQPQVVPWTAITTRTRGSVTPVITARRGGTFLLLVNIPPDPRYSHYVADLYTSLGKRVWSLPVPAQPGEDTTALQIPVGNREEGIYSLALQGIDAAGQTQEIGRTQLKLQIDK